jgi:hypothetical protein
LFELSFNLKGLVEAFILFFRAVEKGIVISAFVLKAHPHPSLPPSRGKGRLSQGT